MSTCRSVVLSFMAYVVQLYINIFYIGDCVYALLACGCFCSGEAVGQSESQVDRVRRSVMGVK
jgi:hypothetical protein